jgi:hypothetical protein
VLPDRPALAAGSGKNKLNRNSERITRTLLRGSSIFLASRKVPSGKDLRIGTPLNSLKLSTILLSPLDFVEYFYYTKKTFDP